MPTGKHRTPAPAVHGRHRAPAQTRTIRLRPILLLVAALVAASGLSVTPRLMSQNASATTAYSIWPGSTVPRVPADPETTSVELGVQFKAAVDGHVQAIRFYRSNANAGPHTGTLWGPDGKALARATFPASSGSGWQQAALAQPVRVAKGQVYTASYRAPHGRYADDQNALSPRRQKVTRALTALRGVYTYGNGRPTRTWNDSNYYVDIVFSSSTEPGSHPSPTTTASTTATPTSTTTSSTTQPSTTSTTRPSSTTTSSTTSSTTSTTTRPSTTSTTTSTPTPTSSVRGCVARPSACGYPDATNTGVTPGTALRASGCITARTAGQVIENVVIDGCTISVEAANVTIRNVKITHTSVDMWAIIIRSGSAKISNVEIAGRDKSTRSVQYAILSQTSSAVTVDKANLYNCADCIQGERMVVTNSYIHDLANPPDAHVDGFQCNAQCGVTLRHNTILNEWSQTSAIALFADFGTPRDSVIEDNLLAGGGYSLYAGTDRATGIKVTGNRFARLYYSKGGEFGPVTDMPPPGSGNTFADNIWDDTGRPVLRP